MAITDITDDLVSSLKALAKTVENPRARRMPRGKHWEQNFDIISSDRQQRFVVFVRQSTLVVESYTAGIRWLTEGDGDVILSRYNGSDHPHRNPLEGEAFEGTCHVHVFTERYVAIGRKPVHYASVTTSYDSVQGALACLAAEWNIDGFSFDQSAGAQRVLL